MWYTRYDRDSILDTECSILDMIGIVYWTLSVVY